jgi:hypothetical protein
LLPAGMKITPYNHHRRLLSFPASSSSNKDYRVPNRAFALIQSILAFVARACPDLVEGLGGDAACAI